VVVPKPRSPVFVKVRKVVVVPVEVDEAITKRFGVMSVGAPTTASLDQMVEVPIPKAPTKLEVAVEEVAVR